MVVPPQPRPPHFAAYIRHFSSKLDWRCSGSITLKLSPQQHQILPPFIFAECHRQNAHFSQKLHSRLHETHFYHIFRDPSVWPKCTPSIWCDTLGTFITFCIHSHVLVTFSYKMAILLDAFGKNEHLLLFDSRLTGVQGCFETALDRRSDAHFIWPPLPKVCVRDDSLKNCIRMAF